jgi:hypothetical protein
VNYALSQPYQRYQYTTSYKIRLSSVVEILAYVIHIAPYSRVIGLLDIRFLNITSNLNAAGAETIKPIKLGA